MYFLALFLYYFGVEKDRPQETAAGRERRGKDDDIPSDQSVQLQNAENNGGCNEKEGDGMMRFDRFHFRFITSFLNISVPEQTDCGEQPDRETYDPGSNKVRRKA